MQPIRTRRQWLKDGVLLVGGVSAGGLLSAVSFAPKSANGAEATVGAEQRLRQLGIELPPPPRPVANYTPAVRVGNILYTSGHGPAAQPGQPPIQGKVGQDLNTTQGRQAARRVGLNVLSTVRDTLGSLDKVVRVVKVLGMVNATTDFTEHPQVINGFSDLMVEVFGPAGKGARSAVGMASLPGNIPVEIEAIFAVRD